MGTAMRSSLASGSTGAVCKINTWRTAPAAARHLVVDHAGDAFDVETTRRHVRRDQDAVWTALEAVQRLRDRAKAFA